MVSTRAKGRKYELLAKLYYEDKGWLIQLAPMSKKFQLSQDFFGMFDLMGIKIGIVETKLGRIVKAQELYVQVKYEQTRGMLPILQKFKNEYLDKEDKVVLLVYKPKVGFIEYICE